MRMSCSQASAGRSTPGRSCGATATATVMWALLMVFAREIVVFFGIDSPELVVFTEINAYLTASC